MKTKRALSLILALTLMLLAGVARAEEGDRLEIGVPTPMSGYFFSDMWGNNTSDMDVREALHGYNTVAWMDSGNYAIDSTVVRDTRAEADASGNKTYTFTLVPGLCYNDGTPITAQDYVFAALLRSSPETAQLGATTTALRHLLGYEDFQQGKPFSGIRLISEDTFSLTIAAEQLPYFYELAMVDVYPAPMSVIAPDCTLMDDGQGAYVVGDSFSAQALQKTLLDPVDGYVFAPMCTCGPYQLASFGMVDQVLELAVNERYQGNYEGQKPAIARITLRAGNAEGMLDAFAAGELGLMNKITDGDMIGQGMQLLEEGETQLQSYPRAGLNMLSFACEVGPTSSAYVRKAIALCVDVDALCSDYLKGYGIPVYGYYGLGQWMAQDQEALLELSVYTQNLNAARNMLETDGWILSQAGAPFDPESDRVRYKKNADGELEPLAIKLAMPEGSGLSKALEPMLTANLAQVGMQLEIVQLPFEQLLKHYYRQVEREFNVFQISTNFHKVFDPYYTFNTGDEYQGVFNTTGIRDAELMALAQKMRLVEAGDNEAYLEQWTLFQAYLSDVLPMAPLYSNLYFDLFMPKLQNYNINLHTSWAQAVLYAYIGEAMPEAAASEESPLEEEMVILD